MQVDTAEKKEVAANAAKATALEDKVEFSTARAFTFLSCHALKKDNVEEYSRQDEAQAQAKEVTTQNTALKTKLDAAVLEASILTKGLEDALAHSKAEIERLQVTVWSCIRFRVSADHSVCCVCMVLGKCKRMVYTVYRCCPALARGCRPWTGVQACEAVWRGRRSGTDDR